MKKKLRQHFSLLTALVFTGGLLFQILAMQQGAQASPIIRRNLVLQAGATDIGAPLDGLPDGGSAPDGVVNHFFSFDLLDQTISSIKFRYCTTAAPVPAGIQCDPPTGLSLTSQPSVLGASTGDATFTGRTNSSANEVVVHNTTTPQVLDNEAQATPTRNLIEIRLDDVRNPQNANETFFVRISTHASTDGSGPAIDTGTVAASTAQPIRLEGTMPESLVFCTGETVGNNVGTGLPDCTLAVGGDIEFDRLFSPIETALATSQMAASTNAGSGYSITVNGPTLTSGSNTIASMASTNPTDTPIFPAYATAQFGMNLVDNPGTGNAGTPIVIGDPVFPVTNGTNYKANPTTNYGTADQYKYYSGNVVAASDASGAGGSDIQTYTVSYIVNVPGSQPAGGYATTLTYICTGLF